MPIGRLVKWGFDLENVDQQRLHNEIHHGQFLSAHGAGSIWNWETPAGKRRWARRVRMLTENLAADMKILELGCGTGYFTKQLVKTGALVTAVDISPDLLNLARLGVQTSNVEFALENAHATSFASRSFDSVLGSSVLHHLDVERAIAEVFRVLRPGGSIAFTEPNMLNPQIAIQKKIPFVKRRLGDSPDETAFFKWSLATRLRKCGFEGVSICPFDFLHPAIPRPLVGPMEGICAMVERVPILREIAGSLLIRAEKPD